MNLSASEPVRSRHRMDNLIAASRSQEGIKGALATGTLEQVLRIYENTAPHFLSETEDEVCTFDASEDSNRPSLSIPVDLVRVVQCLRNLCSRPDNVIYVHERGATSWIKLVVRRLAHISPPSLSVRNSDESNISGSKDDIFVKLTTFSTQTVSNIAACGVGKVSDDLLPGLMQDMLAASIKHKAKAAHEAAISALYNSVFSARGAEAEEEKDARLLRLCADRPLWCQLMLSLVSSNSSRSDSDSEDNSNQPAMEWIGYFVEKVLEKEAARGLLLLLGPRRGHVWTDDDTEGSKEDGEGPTHEQVIFVRALQDQWGSPRLQQPGGVRDVVPAHSLMRGGDVWETAHVMAAMLHSITSKQCGTTARDSESTVQAALAHGAVRVLFETLGSLLSWDLTEVASGEHLRTSLVEETGILKSCLAVIQDVAGRVEGGSSICCLFAFAETGSQERADVLKQALCFLSNLLFRCPAAQMAFLRQEGFRVVLPLCATDFDAPLAREWALLCVRNACEGSRKNQSYVQSLQPQGDAIIQDEAMREAGISVAFDSASNKFALRR